ncbi:MAG: glycosyltransferase [Rhodothermales bacterium]|nr:glycosyltransferase [Rhodothermales bacterium]
MAVEKQTIVCFGPGPAFKGGIADYNTSLALTLDKRPDVDVHIVSWTQQYPAIIPREFVDKSSTVDQLDNSDVKVRYITNYNRPSTWRETYAYIVSLKPTKVIIQWSIAIQGLPLARIASLLARHEEIEIVVDVHVLTQKEGSSLDKRFSRMALKHAQTFIVHAYKTFDELKQLFPHRDWHLSLDGSRSDDRAAATVLKLYHPIYDLFQPDPSFDKQAFKAEHDLREHVFLFFGFIRKYKGLHNAIRAFAQLAEHRDDVSLMICGESFWNTMDSQKLSTKIKKLLFTVAKAIFLKKQDDEKDYRPLDLIDELGIRDRVALFNTFIPNEDVHKYFQVADVCVLYYLTATPSGIESLSYNFELPIVATRVGHFPETIEEGVNGYLADANDIDSMAETMNRAIDEPIHRTGVAHIAQQLSWERYVAAVMAE